MRLVVRTLMFLACLLYGAMPGTAAMDMSMPAAKALASGLALDEHAGHGIANSAEHTENQGSPCPHEKSMTHAPFCAACLVLLPDLVFAEKGRSPHAAPLPALQASLLGNMPAPPLPPPRS